MEAFALGSKHHDIQEKRVLRGRFTIDDEWSCLNLYETQGSQDLSRRHRETRRNFLS